MHPEDYPTANLGKHLVENKQFSVAMAATVIENVSDCIGSRESVVHLNVGFGGKKCLFGKQVKLC
jgi:hypothetical protein